MSRACSSGHARILERLQPDPGLDDFDSLYCSAWSASTVEVLARRAPPSDGERIVTAQLLRSSWRFSDYRPVETAKALFQAGVRWHESPAQRIADVRRELLRTDDWTFVDLMKLLGTDAYCSPEILTELARTPAMRRRMKSLNLIPQGPRGRSALDPTRPKKAKDVLARFGVQLTKTKKPRAVARTPRKVEIGSPSRESRLLRLDRQELFERVWSTPVDKLAKRWGLSGRGLAKACKRVLARPRRSSSGCPC